ncbi:MAG: hypothetical protein L3J35_03530 [Bacteroidales bacterium]|nr:hypothetical protein [Bacteroidales bacterium]
MKTAISIVISILFFITAHAQIPKIPGSATGKSNDINYFNDDPDFKINFFGVTPSKTETPVETALGTINMTTYMYEKSSDEIYMVAISAFPEKYIAASNTNDLLESTKGGFCSNLNLEVINSRKVSINSHEGIYFEAVDTGNYYSTVIDYLVNNVLFQIAILRTDRMPTDEEIDNFIFSFALK